MMTPNISTQNKATQNKKYNANIMKNNNNNNEITCNINYNIVLI